LVPVLVSHALPIRPSKAFVAQFFHRAIDGARPNSTTTAVPAHILSLPAEAICAAKLAGV